MTTHGRSAWTAIGKDNGRRTFVYLPGKPMDGSSPEKGFNYEAVRLGVQAIQRRINALGYQPELTDDGVLGPASAKAIRWFQGRMGLFIDGDCGPATCRLLWRPLIDQHERSHMLPEHILWGIAKHESLLDPAAVGGTTPSDRGLVQFNTAIAGAPTVAQAHDPVYALNRAGTRLRNAWDRYDEKGTSLRLHCTVASWNAPAWANDWYEDGYPPNERIRTYVQSVLEQAKTF